jgi:hypothetical protein
MSGEYPWGVITQQYGKFTWEMYQKLMDFNGQQFTIKELKSGVILPRNLRLPPELLGVERTGDCNLPADKRLISQEASRQKLKKFTGEFKNSTTTKTETLYGVKNCKEKVIIPAKLDEQTAKEVTNTLNLKLNPVKPLVQ